MRAALTRDRWGDLKVMDRNTSTLVEHLKQVSRNDIGRATTIDLQPIFLNHTMNTALEFLGLRDGQYKPMSAYVGTKDFPGAFEFAQVVMIRRTLLGAFYWLYNTKAFKEACDVCRSAVGKSVSVALERTENIQNEDEAVQANNFLDELALQTRDTDRLTSMALDMMLASRDTSAAAMSFLIYYLARHPESFASLRKATFEHFGQSSTAENMTFEKLKSCQYLQWCIHETLRLRPSTPFGIKKAVRDTTLPKGGGPDGMSPIFVAKVCIAESLCAKCLTTS